MSFEKNNKKVELLYTSNKLSNKGLRNKGFALVSCISVMSLLLLLAGVFLNHSNSLVKRSIVQDHIQTAQANARLALMMAIAQLQEATGPDQSVTARADILTQDQTISNRNWVGAWRTTYQPDHSDPYSSQWPLVGQQTDKGNKIYAYKGMYSDLRNSLKELSASKWKKELHKQWLVSSPQRNIDPAELLDNNNLDIVEILGRGTLGELMLDSDYLLDRVLVRKIDVSDQSAIAWWTADNNQKASIKAHLTSDAEHQLTSSCADDLYFIKKDEKYPLRNFQVNALKHKDKVASLSSSHLTQKDPFLARESLASFTHDFTYSSSGLFINTALGGFQRDLTPLLFAKKTKKIIDFSSPTNRIIDKLFTSEYPIITSKYHDVLAPTFSALRHWGLQKYMTTFDTQLVNSATRIRSNKSWPHEISDGATFKSAQWSAEMPKMHPIMTDTRWHYYFSINEKKIRTHIIPRVCLWNPYNREIKINEMIVMMPNPFYDGSGGFHFYFEEAEINRVKANTLNPRDAIHKWIKKSANPLQDQYKARLKMSGVAGLFPNERYLVFTLKKTTLLPGECHVFSPHVISSKVSAGDVNLGHYESVNISQNILSSAVNQGEDHFYFDMASTEFEIQTSSGWRRMASSTQQKLDLTMIHDYRPETGKIMDNFPFILKASNGSISSINDLLTSKNHPTLQLINNGTGGVAPSYYFSYSGAQWGSANTIGHFGSMQSFTDAPYKDAPATHQIGAKLIWLDESTTEGDKAPLRYGTSAKTRWSKDHMVYHPATIANWNVRAQLTSRSPISQCAKKWYLFSAGPWILQFIPKTPQDLNDSPQLNKTGTAFIKNPFGLAIDYSASPNVILFDLPHREHGIHSIAAMRHAMLSPYSWHPTYVIGHSLRDPHSPAYSTAHPEIMNTLEAIGINHWDKHIGGYKAGFSYGAANEMNGSEDLLQIGSASTSRPLYSYSLSSNNDILPYDIAYEINHHLWDNYFISSLPLTDDTEKFKSITPTNQRIQRNPETHQSNAILKKCLTLDPNATDRGFWLNGYYFRKAIAFNVNSTSIPAWIAFLSGTIGINRELQNGSLLNNRLAGFARHRKPLGVANTNLLEPNNSHAWKGLRSLTEIEINQLASAIVDEVKSRGPFISIADFVNRRLTDRSDKTSEMGAIDAAIFKAGLNASFYKNKKYNTRLINRGVDPASKDNNQDIFKDEYLYFADGKMKTSHAATKTWGLPSFLMQSDILEPLAPALTTRGDTFTIRAYGESKENGKIMASAYIEAIVERSPHYVQHQSIEDATVNAQANAPTDTPTKRDPLTGEITIGNLTKINLLLGRKYYIKSFRWLNKNEI